MARDPYPNYDEFGRGAPYCGGDAVGCALCVAADLLARYGKPIPKIEGGSPDLIALGKRMGRRCREAFGTNHGRALEGTCVGGKWGTCCIHLELLDQGLPSKHVWRTWDQIETLLRQRKPVAIPGAYAKFPKVSASSYDTTKPARGRSDTFGGPHMVLGWDVESSTSSGAPARFRVSDGDFGSPTRPVKPPHSSIARADLKAFWAELGWKTCAITTPPPSLENVPIVASNDLVVIHPAAGQERRTFWLYTVTDGRITSRRAAGTGGFSATCSEPVIIRWPDEDRSYTLVKLLSGVRRGRFVAAKYVLER
jgi:hypothetical protein